MHRGDAACSSNHFRLGIRALARWAAVVTGNVAVLALSEAGRPPEGLRVGDRPSLYSTNLNLNVKVLDFVKSGGPKWMVGGTVFEMWLGAL